MQAAFGPTAGAVTEALTLGTLACGLPTVVVAGDSSFAAALDAGTGVQVAGGLSLLLFAAWVNLRGIRVSSHVQQILAAVFIFILAVGVVWGILRYGDNPRPIVTDSDTWRAALSAFSSVCFAYTSLETLSFTTGEYTNPRRDFPIAVAAGYLIALVLYIGPAFAIQSALPRNVNSTEEAPVATLFTLLLGAPGGTVIAFLGAAIVAANLIGAIWAMSRLFYASAGHQLVPAYFGAIHAVTQVPVRTVLTTTALLAGVSISVSAGIISMNTLFSLAGQNFFLLYGLALLAFIRLAPGLRRIGGICTLIMVVLVSGSFDPGLAYPFVLALAATGATLIRHKRSPT